MNGADGRGLSPASLLRRGRRGSTWVSCCEHDVDLAAVQRFVRDGRPVGDHVTVTAISDGECPACRPRYAAAVAADNGSGVFPPDVKAIGGRQVVCGCCRTSWELAASSWVATTGGGLRMRGKSRPVRAGRTISGPQFVVDPLNRVVGVEGALRGGFLAYDASTGRPADDDLVDDVTEAMMASFRGEADEQAELARITSEHHLDAAAADGWHFVALAALGVVRGLERDNPWTRPPGAHGVAEASRARFEELVAAALDSIPPELGRLMENVAVVVEGEAQSGNLFGLYEGVPLTARGRYGGAAPDRITIYQDTISKYCHSDEQIVAQVGQTVIHEVGHHFGIDDGRLRQLGW